MEFNALEYNFRKSLKLLRLFPTVAVSLESMPNLILYALNWLSQDLSNRKDEYELARDGLFTAISKIIEDVEQMRELNKGYGRRPDLSIYHLALTDQMKPIRHNIAHNVGTSRHEKVDFENFISFWISIKD